LKILLPFGNFSGNTPNNLRIGDQPIGNLPIGFVRIKIENDSGISRGEKFGSTALDHDSMCPIRMPSQGTFFIRNKNQ
jgi:hypothetical protein